MPYIINKTDGTELVVLADGTLDTSTSVGLVGRNYVGYGEITNENFVHLLENFSNSVAPVRPIKGQTWFNPSTNVMSVWDGEKWIPIGTAIVSATAPLNVSDGSLWLKTTTNQLYVRNNNRWNFIGPEGVENYGITRAFSTKLLDVDNVEHPVILFYVNDIVVSISSADSFAINESNAILGFSTVIQGMTVSETAVFKGSLDGLAARATKLNTSRTINGVGFDGTSNITVKSATYQPIVPGTHINGTSFDGTNITTWNIMANSDDTPNRLVVRDSNGNFSASRVTANLTGNVTGNLTGSTVTATNIYGTLTGNVIGNASSATRLETTRTINNVPFNGTANITIKATTDNLLTPGVHLIGSPFDGSSALTWNVDATSQSTANKIIVRDGNGDFSARRISADLLGNVAGNLTGSTVTATNIYGTLTGNVIGNSSTATNLQGGSLGSLPYQTSINKTEMLPLGSNGQVLKIVNNQLTWSNDIRATLTPGSYLTGTTYNTSTPTTWAVDATSTNTSNKIVARDSSGNFSANVITASLNGNSASTTKLQTARTINGVPFDGTENITLPTPEVTGGTPVGSILYFAHNSIPAGWLECNGDSVSTSVYSSLFSKIGYTYGGSGGQFKLPDLRGEFIRGWDHGRGIDVGRVLGSAQASQNLAHTHKIIDTSTPSPNSDAINSFDTDTYTNQNGGAYVETTSSGGNESRPRNIALVACIRAYGEVDDPGLLNAQALIDSLTLAFTYGKQQSTSGFTNIVGSFNDNANYFDVFPPSGKTMDKLVAFMPSINVLHYAGDVNSDDSTRCTYAIQSDRIRVWVQNTEQRAAPAANYIAVWRN